MSQVKVTTIAITQIREDEEDEDGTKIETLIVTATDSGKKGEKTRYRPAYSTSDADALNMLANTILSLGQLAEQLAAQQGKVCPVHVIPNISI